MPIVMLAAIPIATTEASRVPSPRINVAPMKVSVISTIHPKKVQCGIMTLTRKSLWAATVGYWICCWTQYPTVAAHKEDRKSTRLNSSHQIISYAVFRLNKKTDAAANETRDDPAAPIPEHNTL